MLNMLAYILNVMHTLFMEETNKQIEEEVDEHNPHGARCAACGELLFDGECIDCDDDKRFGEACKSFYTI